MHHDLPQAVVEDCCLRRFTSRTSRRSGSRQRFGAGRSSARDKERPQLLCGTNAVRPQVAAARRFLQGQRQRPVPSKFRNRWLVLSVQNIDRIRRGNEGMTQMPHARIRRRTRQGATMVLVAILLPILFLLSAFAINIAYTQLIRTELQIATDVSGRAAGRAYALTGSQAEAFNAANTLAQRNVVGGKPFVVTASDLEFGFAERTSLSNRYTFDAGQAPNAVRLTSNSYSSGGLIEAFLPGISPVSKVHAVKSAISTQVELDIALVIDRSGSMAYAADEVAAYPPVPSAAPAGWDFGDPVPPRARWLDTIAAVQVFLNEMNSTPQAERVALATYNDSTNIDVLATTDYSAIVSALNQYSLAFNSGGTNIGGGIEQGLNALGHLGTTRPWATKVVIVMTDGIHNIGTSPKSAANNAADQAVIVFTVTFSNEANQGLMQTVAAIGTGQHFHATNAAQLQEAFREIAKQLPTLLTR